MNGLLKKVNWRGYLTLGSRVGGKPLEKSRDAARGPAHLTSDIERSLNSGKTRRLLTPKKARRHFQNTIEEVAKSSYARIQRRKLRIAIAIIIITNAGWILSRIYR